uniref:packaged DNA stabilization protein n=1 Tax=Escherichia coli TaxID=562 RepID=UPI001FCE76C8
EKRVFLVILFTSFSGSLVSRIPGAVQLFTPLFKADNARVFDLEVESSTGVAQYADRLFLSATTDGINYGREQMIEQNEPFVYDKRVLWKRVGRIRKNVGFKLRVITKSPVTLSGCQIRIE